MTTEALATGETSLARDHAWQRTLARVAAPLWLLPAAVYLRLFRGYRIEAVREIRTQFARLRAQTTGPLLLCANHLTLVDSLLVAWALGSPFHYLRKPDDFAWNTPERTNFASTRWSNTLAYLAKCVPITRGGDRAAVAQVLDRIVHLSARGELALLFPEGGRSRTGRVQADSAAWGVGRVVNALPGCRVLCVYLRGRAQESFSDWPARGESFHVELATLEPKSDARGVRRTRDFAQQIVSELARMERSYFDGRQ